MMTIPFQSIGSSRLGLLLSVLRQGLFYVPFILLLPPLMGLGGIYLAQPCADLLTLVSCLLLIRSMKRLASKNISGGRLP